MHLEAGVQIEKINIKRYRSILDLNLELDNSNNFITVCGENNSGKTNCLRAIHTFFHPERYNEKQDTPQHKYEGSRGGSVWPEITISFNDDSYHYRITRKFLVKEKNILFGTKRPKNNITKKEKLTPEEIQTILSKFVCFFVESINKPPFPQLINSLIDDLYDIEFEKSRFRGLKANLKKSFDDYTTGILEILNELADDMDPVFKEYKENWGVGFAIDSDITKFRDMISKDISFYLNDQSNKSIEGKGSGLQRLGYILLHFRIISKIKNKSIILLVDEPDVFLHQKLQKVLNQHLRDIAKSRQVFITTHSPTFIDSYTLKNVFLFELEVTETTYVRKGNKTFNLLNTKIVDIGEVDGARKIREYLGIADTDYELLDGYNLIVEGEADKKYLSELFEYFGLPVPKIHPAHGADNIIKDLEFFDAHYKAKEVKPKVLVILDNDTKGREIFRKIVTKQFPHINHKVVFVPNHLGETPDITNLEQVRTDNEIEDFIYPEVICHLTNSILKSRSLQQVNAIEVCIKISQPAHKDHGLMFLLENEKNNANPLRGQEVKIAAEGFKSGLAGKFEIKANKQIINLVSKAAVQHPQVKTFLDKISNPANF